jgi:flagellin
MTVINTNIGALNAQAHMTRVSETMGTAMTRLSTGLRINAAKDDAAGMAISEKMTAQIMGLNQAIRNATDGKNLIDTTESAHVEVSSMLQRLRELAVQSANDTNTASDRGAIVSETRQLIAEINRVAETTTFNGMKVLDGSFTGRQFQIGADAGQTLSVDINSAKASDIGAFTIRSSVSVATAAAAVADTGILAANDVTVSGSLGSRLIDVTAGMSAKALATATNNVSAATGVEATAVTKSRLTVTGGGTFTMNIGNSASELVSIGAVTVTDVSDLRSLRDAINAVSGRTGITASMGDTNAQVILTDADGDDIGFNNFADVSGTSTMVVTGLRGDGTATSETTTVDATNNDTYVTGEVTFNSTKAFTATSVAGAADTAFFTAASNAASLQAVAAIDLSTASGSNAAIKVLDVAIQRISQSRSDLGAVSNRLDSTIANLTNISTSVQAAKSNITDADFAAESTNLARGQILSQAATAMLAQANASQQNVLSLLRG